LSKQTNNIVANKICVVSKIGLGTGIFGKMAVKGLTETASHYVMRTFVMLLIKGNLLTLPLFTKQYKSVLARDADAVELGR